VQSCYVRAIIKRFQVVRAVHNLTLACYKRNTNGDQQKDGHVLYRAVPVTAFCCSADYHAAQRQSHTLPRCTTSLPHISTLQNVTPTHIHAAQRHSHTLPRCAMSIPHISTLHNVTPTHNHAAQPHSHTYPRCTSLPHITTLHNVTPTHIHAAQRHYHT